MDGPDEFEQYGKNSLLKVGCLSLMKWTVVSECSYAYEIDGIDVHTL